ncbi:MAG: sensor histidine kinase, partial [Chitinophagales bacterium]
AELKEGKEIAYKLLAKLYKLEKNFEKSCEYLEKFIEVKAVITNENSQKTVTNLTLKYESEKKDLEIKQLYQKQKLLHSKNEELKLFASKASHDMKEPLRMIGSFSDLLKKRHSKDLNESALEFLDIIQNANKRMTQLLDDLLNYTVVGANSFTKKPVCLNEILFLVQQNLQLTIEEKKAIIEVDNLPIVKVHHTDMMQLFQNIISNALKFCTQKTPHIRVMAKELEEEWQITINDNGIGISVENQFKIFDIFTRLHSRQEYEGTGIGLAICKKIVVQSEGEIWIESKLGFGASFIFTLPKPVQF